VTQSELLRAGDSVLERAHSDDLPALLALQRSAYARNRTLLGVEPLPLLADYADIMRDMEVWLARRDKSLAGALILQPRDGDLLIWSIASDPAAQGGGLGRALLAAVEERARRLGRDVVRLYTGTLLTHLVGWYGRHGYQVERIETLSDRSVTHMIKYLSLRQSTPIAISKGEAMRIALGYIEQLQRENGIELELLEGETIERSFGWIFFYQSKCYLQSGCLSDALAGYAPIVVARADGRIHVTGTARPLEYYLEELAAAEGWNSQD